MGKIIFIGNYKGGVGKTATTINLADSFSQKGKKILTIDLDPQSSLSEVQVNRFSEGKITLKEVPDENTLNYVFELSILKLRKYPGINIKFPDTIVQTGTDHYHYILSSLFYHSGKGLDALAIEMKDDISYLSILKSYIDTIKSKYDFILIDCPPSSNLITQSAFLMSDYYLIPTILDDISTNGVIHYIHTINNTYRKYCVDGEDAILAKHFFGACPKLIGIFYNLLRGQVNYSEANRRFVNALNATNIEFEGNTEQTPKNSTPTSDAKSDTESDNPYIIRMNVNNLIEIARSTQKGEISKIKGDFDKLSNNILLRINNLENQNHDNSRTN